MGVAWQTLGPTSYPSPHPQKAPSGRGGDADRLSPDQWVSGSQHQACGAVEGPCHRWRVGAVER